MKQRVLSGLIALFFVASCTSAPAATPPSNESTADALTRALQLHTQGKLNDATVAYYQTLAKDPGNKYAFFDLGVIAQTNKSTVIAESFYRIALEIDPKFLSPLYNLGVLRQQAGANQEAIDLYRRVIAIEPNNASAHFNLGIALRAIGQRSEGDAELARAQQLDPALVPPTGTSTPRASAQPTPTR